jgi:flavin reductase (DIM6/NTAB) family NADH-FMN oxidoreductase RutF
MEIDVAELPVALRYNLMIGAIVPRPIAVVGTCDAEGRPNLAPFSFFTGAGSDPMTLVVCVANPPSGAGEKDTLRNAKPVTEGGTGEFTVSVATAPDQPEVIEIGFERGNPVSIDGVRLDPVSLIRRANELAGRHGFGRLDMVENRVVGIKSREIYETPGLLLLIRAHQELESLTLAADVQRTKRKLEQE